MRFAALIALALALAAPAGASLRDSTYGGGGGGYSQLPACSGAYLGVTLYAQGYYWRCVAGPYHWAIV